MLEGPPKKETHQVSYEENEAMNYMQELSPVFGEIKRNVSNGLGITKEEVTHLEARFKKMINLLDKFAK